MAEVCLRENVRGKGKPNRNGVRQLVPIARLWACCENGKILVGYAKLHQGKDKDNENFGLFIAEGRAYTLDYRLEDLSLRVDSKGFAFVQLGVIDPKTGKDRERAFPFAVQKALPAFLVRCEKYFKQGKLTGWAALVRQAMAA